MNKLFVIFSMPVWFLLTHVTWADADEIKMLEKAKISLSQAITTAEKHSGGQAFKAEIEDDDSRPEYEVKTLKDGRVAKVKIDGVTGEVMSSSEKSKTK